MIEQRGCLLSGVAPLLTTGTTDAAFRVHCTGAGGKGRDPLTGIAAFYCKNGGGILKAPILRRHACRAAAGLPACAFALKPILNPVKWTGIQKNTVFLYACRSKSQRDAKTGGFPLAL